jgi:transcriptional regulator
MYVPPAFKTTDDDAWAFVRARAFGTLIAVSGGRPEAAHVPFVVDRTPAADRIALHVARANLIHKVVAEAPDVLLTVAGPDAYISPDWYASHDQVPTWNYVAAHLTGRARILDAAETERQVEQLSDQFEERLLPKPPWRMSKLTAARKAMMLSAIVGIEVTVTAITATEKLSQNKGEADRAGVTGMLAWQGDWSALAVAELMRKRRTRSAA